jgi:hypothetical protein
MSRKRSRECHFGRGRYGIFFFHIPSPTLTGLSEQDALQVLKPTNDTDMADALDTAKPADAAIAQRLCEVLGNLFAGRVADDAAWAREVLGISTGS